MSEQQTLDSTQPLSKVAPYPEPSTIGEGFKRHVIYLPTLEDEYSSKIELLIGKELLVDGNRHRLGGQLKEETLQGWGYNYYVVPEVVGPMSTLAFFPGEKTQQFITIYLDKLIRYNSKLPIVIYTPGDVEVRYRIWSASQTVQHSLIK